MALWGGRFSSDSADSLAKLSRSVDFDWRLAIYDVRVNLAHLDSLIVQGVITPGNGEIIKAGLKSLFVDIRNNKFIYNDSDEDVHSAIERGLIEKIGPLGGSIRAGRSRNDLVVTDFKLYLIDNLIEISGLLVHLIRVINQRGLEECETLAPGFTHLQHAQPISFGHELAKHSQSLLRDLSRIEDWLNRNSLSPFGAGALSGSPLQPEPQRVAEQLGFLDVVGNSIDAVSDRDFALEALFLFAQIGIHLSRIGEEFCIWNSTEFGWVTLDDSYSTGSSIMPQKKNPDIAELARGKSGRLIGNLTSLFVASKGLPFAYNRDLQEDKEPIFDSIETLITLLPAVTGMISSAKFNRGKIESAATKGYSLATEIADFLARKQVPFAQAHEIAGICVKYCETHNKELEDLTLEELVAIDNRLTSELIPLLNAKGAINSRTSSLGTSITSVREQIQGLGSSIQEADYWISNARSEFSGMMSL